MAVADIHHTNKTDKSRENSKGKEKKERPLTKVVVRRLPPSMDPETFLVQVSPLPDYDYLYLVKADMSLGENAYSRVYINFVNASDIFMFKEKFDNYVFVDQKGHEYPAVVEFATFQKIPRKRKPKQDPKSGTVETDPYYADFLESLKVQPNQEQKPEYSYQFNTENKEGTVSTPLLEFVKQRRLDKLRIREERREQRKQRELERKKLRDEEHKRRQTQKFAAKSARATKSLDTVTETPAEVVDKNADDEKESTEKDANTTKDKKTYFNTKPRFFSHTEKPDYFDKRAELKKGTNSSSRRDDYSRDKEYRNRRFDDYKKDTPRKTKKYSEKREERKNEVRKKMEESVQETNDIIEEKKENVNVSKEDNEQLQGDTNIQLEKQSSIEDDGDKNERDGKDDPRVQRRIRNKDRPTMAIYQPGMLSKRRVDGTEGETASAIVKGAMGAVDGSHIFIKVEKTQQDSYIDRFRRNSINLIAICDANTLFTYVFVGFPGSAHDSRVLENSIFKNMERFGPNHYFKDDKKFHLLGDSLHSP